MNTSKEKNQNLAFVFLLIVLEKMDTKKLLINPACIRHAKRN